ncbi:ATP-binding protein [Oscillatoria nigro-viridis]|nr:ATP-binding protein [Oscillatoria nigro-viridis]
MIAEQHGGTLKVESEMRVSTEFVITVPQL